MVYNHGQFDGNNLHRIPSLTSFHHLPAEVPFSPSTHLPPRSFTRQSLPMPRSLPVVCLHSIALACSSSSCFLCLRILPCHPLPRYLMLCSDHLLRRRLVHTAHMWLAILKSPKTELKAASVFVNTEARLGCSRQDTEGISHRRSFG